MPTVRHELVLQESMAGDGNSIDHEIDGIEPNPLNQLVQGAEVLVKINPKSMLLYIMQSLGTKAQPMFSDPVTDQGQVKVSIKLEVSELKTVSGERIRFSVVESDSSDNVHLAEASAVMKAFSLLQDKFRIQVSDFSSKMVARYESCGIYDLVCEGIGLLEILFSEWEITFRQLEEFALKLVRRQSNDNSHGKLTDLGKIYAMVGDDLIDILTKLHVKKAKARSDMDGIETDRKDFQTSAYICNQLDPANDVFHTVEFTYKDILSFVMSYFGLDDVEYANGQCSDGTVSSSVLMKFPEMHNHQFSGNLSLSAKAYNSIQATEEAALAALVFIEKHFPVKVIDFNYSKRKETANDLNRLFGILSRTLYVADDVRLMWSKLNNIIECKSELFRFDPNPLFAGEVAEGQIIAYRFCSSGIEDLKQHSLKRFSSCGSHIEALQKLTWQLVALKSQFAI